MRAIGNAKWIKYRLRSLSGQYCASRSYATQGFEPLRILFCGSDTISIASLDALHKAGQRDRNFVESIEVVAKPGKWTGPYRKMYKEVPIAERARSLRLPLHQIDTFRGWTPPSSGINLVIAVSFGLLIPRRLIESAKYGGLNVHPSMLPDLWGPAPLQHAILDNDTHAGLTVQTLHPTTMDKGEILAQTAAPGLDIPAEGRDSFASMFEFIAPYGANLLLQTLKEGRFIHPISNLNSQALASLNGREPRHARKLGMEDRHIDWTTWPADKIIRYQRLLKTLWNNIESRQGIIKLVWSGQFQITVPSESNSTTPPGVAYISDDGESVLINTINRLALQFSDCTVAGDKPRSALHVARKYGLVGDKSEPGENFHTVFS